MAHLNSDAKKDGNIPAREPAAVILVIDDERAIRQSLQGFLEDCGYTVWCAENGKQGLSVLAEKSCDLILVDLRMPEMDGFELIERVKQIAPELPTVVISGTGVVRDAVSAIRKGAADYLMKPIEDLSVVQHIIERNLERVRLRRESQSHQEHLEEEVARRTEELSASNAKLRESESRYRLLAENATDVIWTMDLNGRFTYASPSVIDLLGYSPEERLQIPMGQLMTPGSREIIARRFSQELTLPVDQRSAKGTVEIQHVKKDGSLIDVELSMSWILDAQGETVGVQGITRDISARKQAAQEKQELAEQLRHAQKMESIGRLVGGIAHDINNFLIPIIGYADLMRADLASDDPQYLRLGEIEKAGGLARDLIAKLMAFSRKQVLDVQTADLVQTIQDFEKILRATLREDITVELRLPATPKYIKADVSQISQILMNLAVNAQDAMPQGGKLAIEIAEGISPADWVTLSFSDTGSGMEQELLANIFEPFFTTKEQGKGTGLGLSMVHGIVKQHGGNIEVASQIGKGTKFTIRFPRCREKEQAPPDAIAEKTVIAGRASILVVEDNELVREFVGTVLREQGYRVLEDGDAQHCLDEIGRIEEHIDLLLTDVVMGSVNGRELYQQLQESLPDLKVLYMSGYAADVIADRGVLDSRADFIPKPLTVESLTKKVREVLGQTESSAG